MGKGGLVVPLTDFQARLGLLLAVNRSDDSYLAGGAAILAEANSTRFSRDLDYFHDTTARVASAFETDHDLLVEKGFEVQTELSQPGYIRAVVSQGEQFTKIEWAQDSTWRFMPVQKSEKFGYQLHPVDLATNKVLALAGREEVRDLVDTLFLHQNQLSLGALVWAAVGKDPGFSPLSLLEMLKRRGRVRPEELARLDLAVPLVATQIKMDWTAALAEADRFIRSQPADEAGCLYYHEKTGQFVTPSTEGDLPEDPPVPHFGRPGGVLPRLLDE